MFIKVPIEVFIEVKDEDQAQQAEQTLSMGAERVLNQDFPHGDILGVNADGYHIMSEEETNQEGML